MQFMVSIDGGKKKMSNINGLNKTITIKSKKNSNTIVERMRGFNVENCITRGVSSKSPEIPLVEITPFNKMKSMIDRKDGRQNEKFFIENVLKDQASHIKECIKKHGCAMLYSYHYIGSGNVPQIISVIIDENYKMHKQQYPMRGPILPKTERDTMLENIIRSGEIAPHQVKLLFNSYYTIYVNKRTSIMGNNVIKRDTPILDFIGGFILTILKVITIYPAIKTIIDLTKNKNRTTDRYMGFSMFCMAAYNKKEQLLNNYGKQHTIQICQYPTENHGLLKIYCHQGFIFWREEDKDGITLRSNEIGYFKKEELGTLLDCLSLIVNSIPHEKEVAQALEEANIINQQNKVKEK